MLRIRNNERAFLELLKAGLWEQDVQLFPYEKVDFKEVCRIAQEQCVIGLVLQGIDRFMVHGSRFMVPQEVLLPWIGEVQMIEQRNKGMNKFVAELIERLRKENIHALLVKGQGIAQCYERPLWRACGDVDLFLDKANYTKAKTFLSSVATTVGNENEKRCHLDMTINSWTVELHGTLHCGWSEKVDTVIDRVQDDMFANRKFRVWKNDATDVLLPAPDEDVFFVFSHILQHFFKGGIGLRQVFDWCRLLWTFREEIDVGLLEQRIKSAGFMTEWKAFAALAVNTLGMPEDAMPLYDSQFTAKGDRVLAFILETGNFGHNRDTSYKQRYPFLIRKTISVYFN